MGLLQKIKSALGLDGGTSSNGRRSEDVDVTVEREPSTEDEDAVKGTDTSASNKSPADDTTAASDSGTTGADDAAEDGSDTDDAPSEERGDSDGEAASTDVDIEDAEGAAVEEDDESEDAEADGDDESADADEGDESADAEAEPDGSDDPVTELNGIGPAYAERLSGQGIETVGELAVADAAAIAAETDLGEKRVSDWIAQAREY